MAEIGVGCYILASMSRKQPRMGGGGCHSLAVGKTIMGDTNQLTFAGRIAGECAGPFLEVGSKNYGSTQDLRSLFSGKGDYTGVDLELGAGVDVVLDMSGDFQTIERTLEGRRFGTVFCFSVLEHCKQPFRMAENLTRLLKPDGRLCVSVPFVWQFHGYPSDYWRFTHEGVKQLFPQIDFDENAGVSVTSRNGDFHPLDTEIGKIPLSGGYYRKRGEKLKGLTAGCLRILSKLGFGRWLFGYRYVMAPTMITMIGTPKTETASRAA
ncbi:MAG: methyltransferase domain-containing protein [Planctomycetes bacterium]|nr:methyltransferase domain-containing protein [Planctomycetota bacterium]